MAEIHQDDISCSVVDHRPGAVLFVLAIGTFLAPLDSSIVNIALPSIAQQFGERLSAVSWVTTAYLLTSASLLLSMGRVGDLWGLRKLYVAGLLLFGAGSLACALSPTLQWLVASRVFQAVGASMLFAAGPALVARTFPANRRGWALGYISLAVSAGLTVGPALGGLLVGTFGWPSIFLINVPLSVVVAAIAWRLLPEQCPQRETFDVAGAVLAGLALLLFLVGLGEAERAGLLDVRVIGPVAASFLVAGVFVWWEGRAKAPMIDLRLFRSHAFSAGIGAATLAYLALFAVTFTLPFYLVRVHGLDTRLAGLILTVTPLAMAIFAPIAGRQSDLRGSRKLATLGIAILSAGLLAASFLGSTTSEWWVVACLFVVGSGMALFQTPNTAAVLRATPKERSGVGSALIAEARNVGMAVGIAVTAAILGAAVGGAGLPGGGESLSAQVTAQFMHGMSAALRVGSAVAACAALLSWFGRESDAVEAGHPKP